MNARTTVEEAARSRLEIGEPLLVSGFAWIAFPRPQVPLIFLARRPHLVGLTDRRLLIWVRPRPKRVADGLTLVLDERLDALTLIGIRTFSPMLSVRIKSRDGRELVIELRPRDRRIGHRLADELSGPPTEVPAAQP